MVGFAGVTAMETKAREFTFNVAEATIAPREALMVVAPPLNPLARAVLLMLPIEG